MQLGSKQTWNVNAVTDTVSGVTRVRFRTAVPNLVSGGFDLHFVEQTVCIRIGSGPGFYARLYGHITAVFADDFDPAVLAGDAKMGVG